MIKIHSRNLNSLIFLCLLVTSFSSFSQTKHYLDDKSLEDKIALNSKAKKQKMEGVFKEYRLVINTEEKVSNLEALVQELLNIKEIKKCVFDDKSKELRIESNRLIEKQEFLDIVKGSIYKNGFSLINYYELNYTY